MDPVRIINSDHLFACLRPFLSIPDCNAGEVARTVYNALRDHKSPDDIAGQLGRRGIVSLDAEIMDRLTDVIGQKSDNYLITDGKVAELEAALSDIYSDPSSGDKIPVSLQNTERMEIIRLFYPTRILVFQSGPVGKKNKAFEVADRIKKEERTFYNWCRELLKERSTNAYVGGFFRADIRQSRVCRDILAGIFVTDTDGALQEMTARCADYLNGKGAVGWPDEKISAFRDVLRDIAVGMIDRLAQQARDKKSHSLMFPADGQKEDDQKKRYVADIDRRIRTDDLPDLLARIIACTGIIVDTNPVDAFVEQERILCAIWGWETEDRQTTWKTKQRQGIAAFEAGHYADAWDLFASAARSRRRTGFSDISEAMDYADMLFIQAQILMENKVRIGGSGSGGLEEARKKIEEACGIPVEFIRGYLAAAQKTEGAGRKLSGMRQKISAAIDMAALIKADGLKEKLSQALQTCDDRTQDPLTGIKEVDNIIQNGLEEIRYQPCNGRGCYEYALYFYKMREYEKAAEYLGKAVRLDDTDAVLLEAQFLLDGACGCERNGAAAIALLEEERYFENALRSQKKERAIKLAGYYEKTGDRQKAEHYFKEAANYGSYRANRCLTKSRMRAERPFRIDLGHPHAKRICLLNDDPSASPESMNAVLHSSLAGTPWTCVVQDDFSGMLLKDVPGFIEYGAIVFSLMSRDENKNLSDAIRLLQVLNDIAAQEEDEDVRYAFIGRIDIYLLNKNDACPLLIDSAMEDMEENIYFRVHICDPDMMAANELLTRFPTFLPCISKGSGWIPPEKTGDRYGARRVVVLGTDRSAELLIRQIIAVTYLEDYPTELTVVGPDADAMEEKFEEECPELYTQENRYGANYIHPSFYRCDMDKLPINRECGGPSQKLQNILRTADYFVVTSEDDYANLAWGVKLRRNLLRHDPDPADRPRIMIRYRDRHSGWLASRVAVSSVNYTAESGRDLRNHWTEDYALCLYGSVSAFESKELFGNYIEGQALKLHRSYYGTMFTDNPYAEGAFYRRSYNRDSSVAAFIGILYQCFAMGVYYREGDEYRSDDHSKLGRNYHSVLYDRCPACHAPVGPEEAAGQGFACRDTESGINKETLERAAKIEHMRWRGFCASRGWSAPDGNRLTDYLMNGSPKHHLEIGLLHPYMINYSGLKSMCERINYLIDANDLEMEKLPDPCAPDREFVLKAPLLLGYTGK